MTDEELAIPINHLLGTPYVPAVKAYISELTGRARVVGPGDHSTLEIDPHRINVHTNAIGKIITFEFD